MDESILEDIHEIAENSAYLKAVEEKDVSLDMYLQLPPFEQLGELEARLRRDGALTFSKIFHEPTGFYNIKNFLISDYAVDKAIFIKDVEAYRSMRFESARKMVAKLLYQRFVAMEDRESLNFKKGSSVFQIIKERSQQRGVSGFDMDAKSEDGLPSQTSGADAGEFKHGGNTAAAAAAAAAAANANRSNGRGGAPGNAAAAAAAASTAGTGSARDRRGESMLQIGDTNNPIGVYGMAVKRVADRVHAGDAPKDLFDEVR